MKTESRLLAVHYLDVQIILGGIELNRRAVEFIRRNLPHVIDDLSSVSTVEVSTHDDQITIETEDPFDETDRHRAIEIVRANETVTRAIDVEAYEFVVEPIQELSLEETEEVNMTIDDEDVLNKREFGNGTTVNVSVTVEEDRGNDTVTVDRDPNYVDDVVSVDVIDPETDERRFAATVDLQKETIERLTEVNSPPRTPEVRCVDPNRPVGCEPVEALVNPSHYPTPAIAPGVTAE